MVFEKIREIIVDQLGVNEDEVSMETAFEDLGVDSLDLFQIIIAVEEEFGVQMENPEIFKTVGDAVSYVEEKVGEEA